MSADDVDFGCSTKTVFALHSFLKDIESAAAIRWRIYELMDSATWPEYVQPALTCAERFPLTCDRMIVSQILYDKLC